MINMNIALTGANGSIGRELVPFLRRLGHSVFTISSSIPADGKFNYSYEELNARAININIDIFFHLASINSNLNDEEIDLEIQLTKEVLFSLPSLNCKKLIFFSSAKVYGDNSFSSIIYNEQASLNPTSSYGKAKKLCEELIHAESSNLGVSSTIFRSPPILNQSTDSNLGKLIKFSKYRIPIPIFAQGSLNQRSFLSFNNLEKIINFVTENEQLFFQNDTYNMSDHGFISLSELLESIGKSYLLKIPLKVSNLFFNIPLFNSILLKLYGNFVLDNSKLETKMDVKLKTTRQSLPIIYL
jgi:nucleoside-diphosphate-sugar epimerase